MLILTRDIGSQVIIGKAGQVLTEPIVVTLVDVRGIRSRLGFEAQQDLNIVRDEVVEADLQRVKGGGA